MGQGKDGAHGSRAAKQRFQALFSSSGPASKS